MRFQTVTNEGCALASAAPSARSRSVSQWRSDATDGDLSTRRSTMRFDLATWLHGGAMQP